MGKDIERREGGRSRMDKLLPCPFCAGEAELHCDLDIYAVICSKCGAWGATVDDWHEGDNAAVDAIAAWNRRASTEDKPLTLDELRQMESCNDGTPIWIEPTGKYEGVWTAAWYIWPWDTKDFEIDTYADAWVAYRSKPKEEV